MVHTSPFMHDVDGDGVPDVGCARLHCRAAAARALAHRHATVWLRTLRALTRWPPWRRLATYDGEIIFHSAKGALLPQKLVIPKLAVHKARVGGGRSCEACAAACSDRREAFAGLARGPGS